jgi:hypothetical protein
VYTSSGKAGEGWREREREMEKKGVVEEEK